MRSSLLALALLAAPAARAADAPPAETTVFPRGGSLFAPLLADPREVQLGLGYYRLNGQNTADAALGHTWGMTRWSAGREGDWQYEWDVAAMAMSRFQVGGGINQFETIDFIIGLPVEVRHGAESGRFTLFHQSSHLGDDYIRETGNLGSRYSVEGAKGDLAHDFGQWLRVYVDGIYLMHAIPSQHRGTAGFGAELKSPVFAHLSKDLPMTAYLAWDVQSQSRVQWNVNSSAQAGVRVRFREEERSMRLFLEYFDGHSPYAQFYSNLEHYCELGLGFDF